MMESRGPNLLVAAALACLVLAKPVVASAGAMDLALERFARDASGTGPCANAGHYQPGAGACTFDNTAFRKIVSQYGFAIAPTAMAPARTTGFGGFQFSLQGAFTSIDHDADYWRTGTQGPRDATTGRASARNESPDPWLQMYSASVRKGLPFGFELGVTVGYLVHTSIIAGGADLRWSLLEGFRTGALGALPDFAIGGGVRTMTGSPAVQLTVASADAMLSKPLTIADASIFTPYVGYQLIRIFGDSGLIDGTPNTDAIATCNYEGQKVPFGTPGDDGNNPPYTGQPICSGSNEDLSNTRVFSKARITRHRIVAGFTYRYEMLLLGAQFITDLIDPEKASSSGQLRRSPEHGRRAARHGVLSAPRQLANNATAPISISTSTTAGTLTTIATRMARRLVAAAARASSSNPASAASIAREGAVSEAPRRLNAAPPPPTMAAQTTPAGLEPKSQPHA